MKRIVIIGGVAAGATAAARARRLDENASITVLEAGPYVSFANCGLPYHIGRTIRNRDDLLLQTPESFRDRYGVEVLTQTEALAVDPERRTVTARNTDTGVESEHPYDRLILAQGGTPRRPNLPGIDLPHVFTLWTIPEMDAIDQLLETGPRTALVMGGGFIGLEMAEALQQRGLSVTLVEFASHIMPNLDAEVASVLQSELEQNGVSLHTGTAVTEIGPATATLSTGEIVDADIVLVSVGVKPTTSLARQAGLEIGESGGIVVNEYLESSVKDVYVAGDMAEIYHRVSGSSARIPLAGPANRQGRIAASNALGHPVRYAGGIGTSVVKLFGKNAGSTGLTVAQARDAGIDADSVVVHKTNHAGYYPGSTGLTVKLAYSKPDGRVVGAQVVGQEGVDKRIDVVATAIAGELTIHELAELDLAYAPPFSSANDPVNIAAFVAQNRLSGYGPAITADEIDSVLEKEPHTLLDVRGASEFDRGAIAGAINIPVDGLRVRTGELDPSKPILVYCESGQRSHIAARILLQSGFTRVVNVLGAYTSIERYERAVGYTAITVAVRDNTGHGCCAVPTIDPSDLHSVHAGVDTAPPQATPQRKTTVVDVRSPMEFMMGAYPGAVNIPVNDLMQRLGEIGPSDTPVIVYCASGSRSTVAEAMLRAQGYTDVTNGGGLREMMNRS